MSPLSIGHMSRLVLIRIDTIMSDKGLMRLHLEIRKGKKGKRRKNEEKQGKTRKNKEKQ